MVESGLSRNPGCLGLLILRFHAHDWSRIRNRYAVHVYYPHNDLVPYWLFPGDAKIERHVPALPFSREAERLSDLRRALAIYRMVFGQSGQEDLITYLLAPIPEDKQAGIVAELQIDLSPIAAG